ncbi:MAG: AraC family transcriptional regulator [Hyphomicrobiaceae bacterium]|nr:MAG: AraC family transcriptional regulator [Hyphomicrobiaceae bacterium]
MPAFGSIIDRIEVDQGMIRIMGRKDVLEQAVAGGGQLTPGVRTCTRSGAPAWMKLITTFPLEHYDCPAARRQIWPRTSETPQDCCDGARQAGCSRRLEPSPFAGGRFTADWGQTGFGGRMLAMYAAKPKSELLVPFVDCLWCGDEEEPGERQIRLPDGRMQLLFNLGGGGLADFQLDGSPRHHISGGAALQGPRTRSVIIDTSAQRFAFGASFLPGGAAPFFSIPAYELVDGLVDLKDVGLAQTLIERMRDAKGVESRFQIIESALLEALKLTNAPCQRARKVVSLMRQQRTIGAIEAELGMHARGFIAWFRHHMGPSPKEFARIERFQRLLKMGEPGENWGGRAAGAGYSDQAHMIREFKSFAGITPTEYAPISPMAPNHIAVEA